MPPLASVTIRLQRRGMLATLTSRRSPISRMVNRDAGAVRRHARRTVRRRSGDLRRSIERDIASVPLQYVLGRVYTSESYGLFVELGTASPIRPKRGPYLKFLSSRRRDRGRFFMKRQVRGQPGQRYLTLGLLEGVRGKDYTVTVLRGAPFSGLTRLP